MEQKNLEELYHKGELEWEEGEYTVCRGFQWTPPGCHNGCAGKVGVSRPVEVLP